MKPDTTEARLRLRLAENALAGKQGADVVRHHCRQGMSALGLHTHCVAVPPQELIDRLRRAVAL